MDHQHQLFPHALRTAFGRNARLGNMTSILQHVEQL